jgi:pseudaminic acid biosynthesis-associated methylase
MGSKALEKIWAGEFGNKYTKRNLQESEDRKIWWDKFLDRWNPGSVLEVGCNAGLNLRYVAEKVPSWGVDINKKSLRKAKKNCPEASVKFGSIYELPFADGQFSLVFTSGVLIHQHPKQVKSAMKEIIRCSNDKVLCMEYCSPQFEEKAYRGEKGMLWTGPYMELYEDLRLEPIDSGYIHTEGWDDVTWGLFECPNLNQE